MSHTCPNRGAWPITQACALTGNRTDSLLLWEMMPKQLSHAGQGPMSSSISVFTASSQYHQLTTLGVFTYMSPPLLFSRLWVQLLDALPVSVLSPVSSSPSTTNRMICLKHSFCHVSIAFENHLVVPHYLPEDV